MVFVLKPTLCRKWILCNNLLITKAYIKIERPGINEIYKIYSFFQDEIKTLTGSNSGCNNKKTFIFTGKE